jgi:hypothetical protein
MSDTRPGKLAVIAESKGVTVKELVIDALKKGKSQVGAALVLGVNVNTIRHHVKSNGLQINQIVSVTVSEALPLAAEAVDVVA